MSETGPHNAYTGRTQPVHHAVREGVAGDAPACATILNDWIDATPWMPRVHTHGSVERHYREVVFPTRRVWVVGAPLAGFLALDEHDGFVTALYTARPGHGLGRALLDCAKVGRDRLQLWTFVANQGAQRFYAREGFSEAERTDGDNEEGLPDIRYGWEPR